MYEILMARNLQNLLNYFARTAQGEIEALVKGKLKTNVFSACTTQNS